MGGTNFRTVYVNLSDAHGKMVNILFLYISSTHAQINLIMSFYLNAQLVSIYSTMLSVVSTCIAVHCVRCVQDDLQMDEFPLGEEMHHIPGDQLFDFMADKLIKFAAKIGKK